MKTKARPIPKNRLPFTCIAFLALASILLVPPAWAGFGFKLDGTLDKEAISHAYFEGEFARVLPPLEMYRQAFPATATREDSIFVFKFLSVIYAADSTTRPKAESYMVQLIRLMPTIELVDMYISDNIHAIFNNVKQNYLKQQHYVREYDAYGRPLKDSTAAPRGSKGSTRWIGWALGGIGTAAAVAGAYYVLNNDPKPNPERVTLSTNRGQ